MNYFSNCAEYGTCDQDLSLEPRLLEYLKKKKYFKDNNIESKTLEKEYSITENDKLKIRSYLRGDSAPINRKIFDEYVDISSGDFPSSSFKKDPRFDRIKIKQQKEQDAKNNRNNYEIMSKTYDMYSKEKSFASMYGDDFNNENDFFNPHVAQQKPHKMTYTNPTQPKSIHNGYLPQKSMVNDDPNSIDSIIGDISSYRKKIDGSKSAIFYEDFVPERDEFSRTYHNMPFMNGNRENVDIDSYVKRGETSQKSKTHGFKNPIEHYFSYIGNDIQDPDHVVSNRGQATRLLNHGTARPQ